MSDILPPDLDRLRVIETFLDLQLQAVRAEISRREGTAPAPPPSVRPARPPWLVEYDISAAQRPLQVHVEDCAVTGPRTRRVTEGEARRWVVEVGACQFCRPDALLGTLE
ncbi:DUF6233 domain-containing protein [Streptomyces sp. t39]|uniref:DUF6233 domain-containing protein n=1 Tax=Streptomyces sp. t39 TaxID=1828156 RepID=UPI0011CE427C|nr:DUF6233 domain-containing protein [Streptomyces sp. t39]TXS35242.1 hypothetical protein EAO77_37340 [Streptomyces sp. t39]